MAPGVLVTPQSGQHLRIAFAILDAPATLAWSARSPSSESLYGLVMRSSPARVFRDGSAPALRHDGGRGKLRDETARTRPDLTVSYGDRRRA
jgi:hypothetical protein